MDHLFTWQWPGNYRASLYLMKSTRHKSPPPSCHVHQGRKLGSAGDFSGGTCTNSSLHVCARALSRLRQLNGVPMETFPISTESQIKWGMSTGVGRPRLLKSRWRTLLATSWINWKWCFHEYKILIARGRENSMEFAGESAQLLHGFIHPHTVSNFIG